jgi:hypothetical protein
MSTLTTDTPARPLHQRLVARVIAGADRLMRAALRRMLMGQGVGPGTTAELDELLLELSRYNDPAILADPDRLLAPPPGRVRLDSVARRSITDGHASHYSFPSPYRPHHPTYARAYAAFDRVGTVHLHAWLHRSPAPASVLLLHGWGVGDRRVHALEFNVRTLFHRLGLDVYFYVAPFHGPRRPASARFSGELHPSVHIIRTNEAFIQTIRELRATIGLIRARSPALGVMGSSLGGYTAALLASLDDRLDFAAPIIAPASLAALFWEHGAGEARMAEAQRLGLTRERFIRAWSIHSPLTHTPKVPWSRRLIVAASDDALVTPPHVEALWQHWGRPRRFEFTGGHILQVGRRRYIDELERMLRAEGVLPALHG